MVGELRRLDNAKSLAAMLQENQPRGHMHEYTGCTWYLALSTCDVYVCLENCDCRDCVSLR